MPKTDLKIYSTDSNTGAKITSSVTYVNPNVSNSVLKDFAEQLNRLTTNNYSSADRVDTTNVDSEQTKQFRNMVFSGVEANGTATLSAVTADRETINPMIIHLSGSTTVTMIQSQNITTDNYLAKFEFTVPSSGVLFAGLVEKNETNAKFYADFVRAQI